MFLNKCLEIKLMKKILLNMFIKLFSKKDIALAENELETNINNPYDRVPWMRWEDV